MTLDVLATWRIKLESEKECLNRKEKDVVRENQAIYASIVSIITVE